ncbi:MAG: hypothetical protein R6V03_03205 [Kiritimatiellia bacterium]
MRVLVWRAMNVPGPKSNFDRAAAAGVVLYLLGAFLHLGLADYARSPFIFGDEGDGFFNMWVMDHSAGCIARGDWDIIDGRIFWPKNEDTLLWSDNLFVPMLAFSVFRVAGAGLTGSFWGTAMLLSVLGYAACFFLLRLIFRMVEKTTPGIPAHAYMLVPVFAYFAAFSAGRLIYFRHFQNLSSLWLFSLTAGGIGYWYHRRKWFFRLMVISEVLLLYSAPYFAVLGAAFVLGWAAFQAIMEPAGFVGILRENRYFLVFAAVVFAVLAAAYASVEKPVLSTAYIHENALGFKDLVIPEEGLGRKTVEQLAGNLPRGNHEKPGYLGAGVLLVMALLVFFKAPEIFRWLVKQFRSPGFWTVAVLAGICVFGRGKAGAVGAWAGLLALVTAFFLFIRGAVRRRERTLVLPALAFCGLCALFAYGAAFGPRSGFFDEPVNPSVWGLFALVLPGFRNMRAIGRLAVVGHGMLLVCLFGYGLLFLARSRGKRRKAIFAVIAVSALLQFAEQTGGRVPIYRYDPRSITPTEEERSFFSAVRGVAAVFPAVPFHRNTRAMLYFDAFNGIVLMNGYSSRSTRLWDRVMEMGMEGGQPTAAQIARVRANGCDYIILWKTRLSPERVERVRARWEGTAFENNRFLVLRLL